MDPVTLATVTAALTALGTEAAKATAAEAGKNAWAAVRRLFGWSKDPPKPSLAPTIARQLKARPDLVAAAVEILSDPGLGTPAALAGQIQVKAGKVVIASTITVGGDFKM